MVFMPHWPKQTKLTEQILLGTDRVCAALAHLGNPQKRVPPIIHVAGTNGKGSSVAYTARILEVAGYSVHVFTSPHLIDFNERIVLRGRKITDNELFQILEECRFVVEKHSLLLTMFEATTVAAFIAFANIPADFLILEVGMGGRLDATNVIDNPLLSIITSISHDHQEFLGDDLPAIAFEKAGIIKQGAPCVIGRQTCKQVMDLVDAYANNLGCPTMMWGRDWLCNMNAQDAMTYTSEMLTADFVQPSLRGMHQIDNAGNAITGALMLNKHHAMNLSVEQINDGLATAEWPARLEPITSGYVRRGMSEAWEVYMDGAHNTGAAVELSKWLAGYRGYRRYMILGMTRGKNTIEFLAAVKGEVDFVCGVCVNRELNAQRGDIISNCASELEIPTQAFDYVPSALDFIVEKEPASDKVLIIICGSLYLLSDIKRMEMGLLV